jgi:hypothetical protein
MITFASLLGVLQSVVSMVPAGSFRGFLETLIQILTFAMGFQAPV